MRVLSTLKYTALRMLRAYIVLLLLLVVPIILITLFAIILSGIVVAETGQPAIHGTAMIQVLVFQLFGGSIVMAYIQSDLFSPSRIRFYLLPFNVTMYAFSILLCGTVFSILLGIVLMIYSQFVLGIIWLNWAWSIFIIIVMAVLSSVVYLIITFSVKKHSTAEWLSVIYGVGLVVLAGLFFPMPDNAFFQFMGSYGNPLTLAIMSIEAMNGADAGKAWFCAGILMSIMGFLLVLMLILGRRRMA